jgi:hypothetical protein
MGLFHAIRQEAADIHQLKSSSTVEEDPGAIVFVVSTEAT